MIGLKKRSSRKKPCSGSEAATGVPLMVGVVLASWGVGFAALGAGVAVASRVGRGVRRLLGLSDTGKGVGVGGGAGRSGPQPAANDTRTRKRTNRRIVRAEGSENHNRGGARGTLKTARRPACQLPVALTKGGDQWGWNLPPVRSQDSMTTSAAY